MGIRLAPSVIDRYLREPLLEYYIRADGTLVQVRIPYGAGSAVSARLSPFLELLVDEVHRLALRIREEKNRYRRAQSQYEPLHPRPEQYDEAARLITKDPLKYINSDSFDKGGGEQRGETDPPKERSESTDPHGGHLE